MRWTLYFTARKRAPWGDRYQWRHIYGDDERAARRALARLRRRYRHEVRIELVNGRRPR